MIRAVVVVDLHAGDNNARTGWVHVRLQAGTWVVRAKMKKRLFARLAQDAIRTGLAEVALAARETELVAIGTLASSAAFFILQVLKATDDDVKFVTATERREAFESHELTTSQSPNLRLAARKCAPVEPNVGHVVEVHAGLLNHLSHYVLVFFCRPFAQLDQHRDRHRSYKMESIPFLSKFCRRRARQKAVLTKLRSSRQ